MKISLKIILLFIFVYLISLQKLYAEDKIKIGLLIPLSGKQSYIGNSILKSVRLAVNKIDNQNIEIVPKDTKNDPVKTLAAAKELSLDGVKIVMGPVFSKNLIYLDKLNKMIFLSLTNKNIKNPKNIISAGINASSQIKTIKKFKKMNNINRTIFLIPNSNFKEEIETAISNSKIKLKHIHIYETNPTELTKQIEKITMYKVRKQNVIDEIKRLAYDVSQAVNLDAPSALDIMNKRAEALDTYLKKDGEGKYHFADEILSQKVKLSVNKTPKQG